MIDSNDHVFSNTSISTLEEWKLEKTVLSSNCIRYDWSQTNNCVFLTIYRKNVKQEDFFYFIKKKNMLVTLKINDKEIYNVELVLFSSIVPEQTQINITSMKIEIILEKEVKGLKWDDLRQKESVYRNTLTKEKLLSPFSGKSVEEWNNLAKHIKEEEKQEETNASNLDVFFKKLYEEGDDDMKRAMIKSFQTSNGTVLSTNWKEVQHANYEKDSKEKD